MIEADFVKLRRKQLKFTQVEFAERTGVALTVIRKIEQGKNNLSLSKAKRLFETVSSFETLVNKSFQRF